MMWWGHQSSVAVWLWPVIGLLVAIAAAVVALILIRARGDPHEAAGSAVEVLRQRFARGEIDEAEYRERLATLEAGSPWRPRGRRWRSAPPLVAAAIVLLLFSVVAAAAMASRPSPFGRSVTGPSCNAPVLPGQTVDVTLSDMGAMMGGGGMMGGRYYPGGSMGPGYRLGMMSVTASASTVPAGAVSFRVWNAGSIVHEMVVLRLAAGGAGTRPVGQDGRVSEDGSLGEASASCAGGAGDGIAPGALSWVTIDLAPGRYELICNLPGHYAMGMFTELEVQ